MDTLKVVDGYGTPQPQSPYADGQYLLLTAGNYSARVLATDSEGAAQLVGAELIARRIDRFTETLVGTLNQLTQLSVAVGKGMETIVGISNETHKKVRDDVSARLDKLESDLATRDEIKAQIAQLKADILAAMDSHG